MTTLGAAALSGSVAGNWRGDPSSLQPYVPEAHTILKHLLILEREKKKIVPTFPTLRSVRKRRRNEEGGVAGRPVVLPGTLAR